MAHSCRRPACVQRPGLFLRSHRHHPVLIRPPAAHVTCATYPPSAPSSVPRPWSRQQRLIASSSSVVSSLKLSWCLSPCYTSCRPTQSALRDALHRALYRCVPRHAPTRETPCRRAWQCGPPLVQVLGAFFSDSVSVRSPHASSAAPDVSVLPLHVLAECTPRRPPSLPLLP